ncbi:MAG: hypothetical protein WA861_04640, partial [Candidatus Binatus sp.]
MKGIRIKAILAGITIDILGSTLVGVVEGVIIFVIASRAGDTSRQHLLELKPIDCHRQPPLVNRRSSVN